MLHRPATGQRHRGLLAAAVISGAGSIDAILVSDWAL
jgi:hypothetical protein